MDDSKSATEILMSAMEDFGGSEPRAIIVIFSNEDEDIIIRSNMRRAEAVGFCEIAKDMILKQGGDLDG